MANLTTSEAHKAIKIPIEKSGYSFEEKMTRQIIEETRGYPYFLQFYSYYLVKNAKGSNIRLSDYKKLRSNLINELDLSFYQDRLNKATPVEQDVLEAMARSGNEVSPTGVLKFLKIKKSMLFAYLRNLIDKNLVYKTGRGKYSFTVPLFREFLLRQGKKR